MVGNIDWMQLKTEYVRGDITLSALSEKYHVHRGNLSRHAMEEKWKEERTKYRQRTYRKSLTRASAKDAQKLAALRSAADRIAILLQEAVQDKQLPHRHLIRENGEVKEMEFVAINPVALECISRALVNMTHAIRDLYDLETESERFERQIAHERLDIERDKVGLMERKLLAEGENDCGEIRVVLQGDVERYAE